MGKKLRNVLIGTGVAAGVLAGISIGAYKATEMLMKIALDRETPKGNNKSKARISGSKKLVEFADSVSDTALKLTESDCTEVEITSPDNITLVGHYHECPNAKRVIVAMHGWRSSWAKDFGAISEFWHSNGCSVLYAEQRGQNKSGGDYMGFGMLERHDCLEWVKWVNERTGGSLPIYLAGVSMGAATVLMATGLELPKNVHGVMADCGFTSPHAIWKHVMEKNLHMSYGIVGIIANDICKKKINMGAKDYSATHALAENYIPVLFVHGTDDHFVPVEMTYENYKACAGEKRLLIVPGADHAMSYYLNKKEYEKNVLEFFAEFDDKAVPDKPSESVVTGEVLLEAKLPTESDALSELADAELLTDIDDLIAPAERTDAAANDEDSTEEEKLARAVEERFSDLLGDDDLLL